MKLLDILHGPWAIDPAKLLEIQGIYVTHMRGEKIDIKGVEAALGRPLNNADQGYYVVDGVAIVPITGVISKRMNLFSQISGGASSELIARDLKAAAQDPAVNAIILQIDSPGGTVDGTETLANLVREINATKPVVAFADGMMASAAYWIGSAAAEIVMSDQVAIIGSIGVVASHTDYSGRQAQAGIKTTEITAGKFKRAASQYEPLSETGRQTIQDQVDQIYSVFVQAVADFRGVSVETVLQDMADGKVFVGQQAINAGLVDGVSTLDALIAKLSQQGAGANVPQRNAAAITQPIVAESINQRKETDMDITMQTVLEKAPDVAAALREEGAKAAREEATAAGAAAERARIEAVFAHSMPGHEPLIKTLAFDGKTSGAEAAVAVLGAEKKLREKALADRREDASEAAAHVAVGATNAGDANAVDKSLPVAERCKAIWDKDAKIRADFDSLESFTAYTEAVESGKVRVLGKTAA